MNPSQFETLKAAGMKAFHAGDYDAAIEQFRGAEAAARELGDELAVAEMANNRAICCLSVGEARAALEMIEPTIEAFHRADDARREAQARGNLAAACSRLGQLDRAAQEFERAAGLFAGLGDGENRAAALRSLSEVQLKQGRPLEAVASMRAGLDGLKRPNLAQRTAREILKAPSRLLGR